jgi:hypothetical protein
MKATKTEAEEKDEGCGMKAMKKKAEEKDVG